MVKLYGMESCPYCADLKDMLKTEGIEFEYVDINLPENDLEYKKIAEVSKSDDVPIVRIGPQLLVPNVSFRSLKEACELTKKILG